MPSPVKTSEDLFLPQELQLAGSRQVAKGAPEDPAEKGAVKAGAPRWGPPPLRGMGSSCPVGLRSRVGKRVRHTEGCDLDLTPGVLMTLPSQESGRVRAQVGLCQHLLWNLPCPVPKLRSVARGPLPWAHGV